MILIRERVIYVSKSNHSYNQQLEYRFIDLLTKHVGNGRIVFDFKTITQWTDMMVPNGLVIDSNGLLYATSSRNLVYVIDPTYVNMIYNICIFVLFSFFQITFIDSDYCNRTSKVVRSIDIGVPGSSGLVFGGPKRENLYILGKKKERERIENY